MQTPSHRSFKLQRKKESKKVSIVCLLVLALFGCTADCVGRKCVRGAPLDDSQKLPKEGGGEGLFAGVSWVTWAVQAGIVFDIHTSIWSCILLLIISFKVIQPVTSQPPASLNTTPSASKHIAHLHSYTTSSEQPDQAALLALLHTQSCLWIMIKHMWNAGNLEYMSGGK